MDADNHTKRRVAVLCNHLLKPQPQPQLAHQKTCGIVALVGKEPVPHYLVEGLRILESRGYDSAGISTISSSGELVTTKYASSGATNNAIDLVEKEVGPHNSSFIGIAHTRWATHGGASDNNAHPHHDASNRIAVCHNGVIENYAQLKKWLVEHDIVFRSETDTEVIAQMIGLYVKEGQTVLEATRATLEKLRGTWGLVVMDVTTPDQLIVAKNGSPMVIGLCEGKTFVSSEPSAFRRHTKEFIALEDNEIAVITPNGHNLVNHTIQKAESQTIELSPDPYPHWTIKEIMEQPESLARALNYGGRLLGDDSAKLGGLSANLDVVSHVEHLVIAACGTSFYSGLLGAHFMKQLESFKTVQVLDAAELEEFHLPEPTRGGLLVISQSGETKDVHRALQLAQAHGLPCISVVNSVGSLIARTTSCGVYLNAGRENAVASTKAFTSQVTVLALLALWFSKSSGTQDEGHDINRVRRKSFVDSLHRLPTSVGMTLSAEIRSKCKEIAKDFIDMNVQHIFVLGKGAAMPIALEGALKIKEISYLHAEGYPGGALKHGPFALIETGIPVIFIVLDDQHEGKMRVAVEEVQARGASIVTITNIPNIWNGYSKNMGHVITVPTNGALTSLLTIIPLQLLAYELSLMKGVNPDRPRHLAKTVTVD
eukprot:TRINITY_DN10565_c0_g1_i1.p1 TRINITY_DN10565_c0_g1~~TRINITY_DN10565_c0_g1_i1.p1  ORF type:complete len:655 (-),score=136.66 TRINITY_DN10565_c0_g1_i1:92-2056(-)